MSRTLHRSLLLGLVLAGLTPHFGFYPDLPRHALDLGADVLIDRPH